MLFRKSAAHTATTMFMALMAVFACAQFAWAQSRGNLRGKVADGQGKGLAQVEVKLYHGSEQTQRTSTAGDGSFAFDSIIPGTYRLELVANGRTEMSPRTFLLRSSETSQVDLVYESTPISSSASGSRVEIKAASSTIQADSAEVSRSYETQTVRSLPLRDRQNQDLISLMPGVTPPAIVEDRVQDPQRSRVYNINGLPDYANSYFQDGAFQRESFSGRQSRIAPNASVQQLDTRTSNFNAEYGLAGGGHVNTVTRPGTNGVHGSVFGLHTNRFFSTRNPTNFSTSDPGFNVNQFGGSMGGPVVKDKTFFFLAYEGYLRRGSVLQIDTVPDAALRAGDFGEIGGLTLFNPASGQANGAGRIPFPNNRIPATSINPASQAILNQLPLPNQEGAANNLVGAAMLREDQHRMDGKIDHRFSEKSTGFFRYGFTHGGVDRGSQLGLLGNAASAAMRNHNAVASLTQSFSNSVAAEFRLGYSRFRNAVTPLLGNDEFNSQLASRGFNAGLPEIRIAGVGAFGVPGSYYTRPVNNTYDGATNWNWHNGMHHLKLGAQVVHIRADGFADTAFSPAGTFQFNGGPLSNSVSGLAGFNPAYNSFAAFLTGSPTTAGVANFTQTPTFRQTLISGYATDTINLWKNAHLELGVRYDVFTPLTTRFANGATEFDPASNSLRRFDGGVNYDWNNVAPRVGLVVRPIERMAFRAGYGILYFPTPFNLSPLNQANTATQLGAVGSFARVPFATPASGTFPEGSLNPNQPAFVGSLDSQTPYVQSFSAMMQGDLGNGFLLDIGYQGNLGRQLPYQRSLNAAAPGSGLAGFPFSSLNRSAPLYARGTGLNSNYNALQVNLTKRFAAGLSLAGAYTFGKALDTGFDQADPFNTRNNYGPADWDRKHILAISHLWRLPFGPGTRMGDGWASQILGSWQLNGILRWATGTPYTVTADPLFCNCPGAGSISVLPNSGASLDGRSSFDPSGFPSGSLNGFGAAARNGLRGPDFFTYDASIFRRFPYRENFSFELRAEAYNVTNNTNLVNPNSSLASLGAGTSTRTVNGYFGRLFQVGARILF
jgi:hypothetical protein